MTASIGELNLTKVDGAIWINIADPRILVFDDVIGALLRDEGIPGTTLDWPLLTVRALNGCVVYRLLEKAPERYSWIAEQLARV